MNAAAPLLLDSITDADAAAQGRAALTGSHGGLFPAALASRAGLRAVLFNDAGRGLDNAGIAGVMALESVAMAAAAAGHESCRIGSAGDALAHGIVSAANAPAAALGVAPGMAAAEAMALLAGAPAPRGQLDPMPEARQALTPPGGGEILLVDSASLVRAGDSGAIIVTGSHGGLIGGDPARALKAKARLAAFNDAGVGPDEVGCARLPALQARGVAAVTLDCATARIGDARSGFETGVISRANPLAEAMGARPGRRLRDWIFAASR